VAKNSEDSLGRKNSEDSLVKIQSVTKSVIITVATPWFKEGRTIHRSLTFL
jgi:hypothetical protein